MSLRPFHHESTMHAWGRTRDQAPAPHGLGRDVHTCRCGHRTASAAELGEHVLDERRRAILPATSEQAAAAWGETVSAARRWLLKHAKPNGRVRGARGGAAAVVYR